MLFAKIISCALTFILLFITRTMYEMEELRTNRGKLVVCTTGMLGITFCILLITTNWNPFAVPKILLFIVACLFIWFKEDSAPCIPFRIGLVVIIIAYLFAGVIYLSNLEKCETPDVATTTCTVICAKDNSSITGSMSGGIFYVQASVSEESVYKYYYQLEDGGIKQGSIPADSTTIYFIEAEKEPYLETTVTTTYWINNNNNPVTHCLESSETTYKLYVPDGSVTNVYEFDAN